MKPSTWTALLLPAIACAAIGIWQHQRNAELEEKVEEARQTLATLERGAEGSAKPTKPAHGSTEPAGVPGKAEAAESPPVSPKTRFSASEFLRLVPDEHKGPASMIRMLPDFLGMLEDYSTDELFQLLDELQGMKENQGKAQSVAGLLLVILSGTEPERVLAFAARHSGNGNPGTIQEVEVGAFSALARKDPARAREYLETANWSGRLEQQARIALMRELARRDLLAALEYSRETHMDNRHITSILATVAREPAVRARMASVLGEISDAQTRTGLATSLVGATYVDEGFEGVSAFMETIDFPDTSSRDSALQGAANMAMSTKPGETLEWIAREASENQRHVYVNNIMRSWANRNYNEAAAWLDTQESSPERDSAIAAFSSTVVGLDPEAAAIWAGQIADHGARTKARREVFNRWSRQDPEAMRAWMVGQDINPSNWLP